MIKIGLTPCFMYPDKSRTVFGAKSLTYMENDMARYVARKGVMPILIPDVSDDLLKDYVDQLDGIVLQGGSDLSPESYGEDFLNKDRWPGDRYRDQYEFKIIELAMKRDLPIFGICRGFQVLNAYFGGTLYQDLQTETKTEVEHRHADKYDNVHHSIDVEEGSFLAGVYGANKLEVNSVHHQGVSKLADDLVAEAYSSDDKIIEAFRYKDLDEKYIVGVQWHPEFSPTLGKTVCDPEPLMDEFLKRIKK